MKTIDKLKVDGKLVVRVEWVMDNPGKQLTSSFKPIYSTAAEWFGEYYKEFNLDS